MAHLPPLISDLAIILGTAAVSTILFSKMKQPIVLGYLIAGFLVGPYFTLFPTVVDSESVHVWAEMGVIFLLFGLGLEFSFKKLAKVGKSASMGAIFEIITMSALGYFFGRLFNWNHIDSIFLGAILSMSSTTIIIKAFDEAGLKGRGFVGLVFGILIVEDLMAILLMVILAAISVPDNFSGSNLVFLISRLGFYLLLWFLMGIYLLPTILKKMRSFLTDEIMLVVSVGLCLLMVMLATKADFSAALGAFIMGSLLAETEEGHRIEKLLLPVKDLFAAVFFVSVGMMIDPAVIQNNFGVVIIITVVTIIGKLFGSGVGVLLSGRSLRQSVQAGMSLAQIGEFSFIIATLGVTLKVTSDFLYPIVIAVSAVTTFTTPYFIKFSDPIYEWIDARIPQRFKDQLKRYEVAMGNSDKEGALGLLWRTYGFKLISNIVIIIAITLAAKAYVLPKLMILFVDPLTANLITGALTLSVCSPFLWAIILKVPATLSQEEITTLDRLRSLQLGVIFVRIFMGIFLLGFIFNQFINVRYLSLIFIAAFVLLMFLMKRFLQPLYLAIEKRFLKNLNAKELAEIDSLAQKPLLAPWDATLVGFVVSSDSTIAGETLAISKFRELTGATVTMIDRGQKRIFAPGPTERLLPNDKVFLIGTDEQNTIAQKIIEAKDVLPPQDRTDLYSLEQINLKDDSPYINKSIRDCGIREKVRGLIVGLEREGKRILNPDVNLKLLPGDLVWVVGQKEKIKDIH